MSRRLESRYLLDKSLLFDSNSRPRARGGRACGLVLAACPSDGRERAHDIQWLKFPRERRRARPGPLTAQVRSEGRGKG